MIAKQPTCQEAAGDCCELATRPDPRFPCIDVGDEVLCEECYQNALDEMQADIEAMR